MTVLVPESRGGAGSGNKFLFNDVFCKSTVLLHFLYRLFRLVGIEPKPTVTPSADNGPVFYRPTSPHWIFYDQLTFFPLTAVRRPPTPSVFFRVSESSLSQFLLRNILGWKQNNICSHTLGFNQLLPEIFEKFW